MIKRLERLKNTVNKCMADIRPDRLTTCQSEQKSVISRRPTVFGCECKRRMWENLLLVSLGNAKDIGSAELFFVICV
jgi:hypothetical protein